MKKIYIFIAILLFTGCAKISPQSSKAVAFTVISPSLKINDVGFIHRFKEKTELQIYNSGVSILKMDISYDKICLNSACDDEISFNRKFFKNEHYIGFFSDILNHKPIYNEKNLVKTDCGFIQNISENFIEYKLCNEFIEFADTKNKITAKINSENFFLKLKNSFQTLSSEGILIENLMYVKLFRGILKVKLRS